MCFVMQSGATSYDIMKVNKFGRFVMQSDRKQVARQTDSLDEWLENCQNNNLQQIQ